MLRAADVVHSMASRQGGADGSCPQIRNCLANVAGSRRQLEV
ncbi:hypothetical protein HMPREF9595_00748 [Cutibacterium acnes HL005PA2]|nr:hypothetical protein HMPREF9609_01074 [Cutibacterium acnes HL027PA1]EFT31684.1 hypothetical protein HMPREF9595_00748 [Cutibacterium acnes HL005PA2]